MEESPVPDKPAEEIVRSLFERERQRRRAIDLAFEQFAAASTESDQVRALDNISRMIGVNEEFRQLYPEVFQTEEE